MFAFSQTRRKETTRNDPAGFSSLAAAIAAAITATVSLSSSFSTIAATVFDDRGDRFGRNFGLLRPLLFKRGGQFGDDQMKEFERAPEDQEDREDHAHPDQQHLPAVGEFIAHAFERFGYVNGKKH